ncbi:putative bromodomain-containing protein 10 [Festucalex cinctus]
MSSASAWTKSGADDMDLDASEDGLSNGASVAPGDHPATSNDGMSDFSNSDISLPEVCVTTNFEETMSQDVQQAHRIFSGFLLDKHKAIAGLFLHAVGHQEAQCGVGGICATGQARLKQSMCLRRMEEKFVGLEYQSITEFVADFRLMLENCYRYHGVDHWLSKQAQKLEIMLEQKLTLLSRTLREKTTLAVTSKGRFGSEDERAPGGTSTRRRLSSRSLATITVGGHESVMVQALRMEEQQRAKEEKRQRELEKREADEMSAKAVEEWEQTLLSQASPHTVDTLWELPAIGHFLCLAQTVLNLPEIVFFELERCLLMPRCSSLLSKIMSSLMSPWQRRATLHRRPSLPYRRWEAELRLRVKGWYRSIGGARNQVARAEQLGLCHQFFSNLGEASPLEEKPFHLLPFRQRVWLLKGLCDHVYETQKDVQDAVLAQPIHECRESILGYDSKDNAYIHFPHFCGADLRIYCQSPSTPPAFPFPSVLVRRVDVHADSSDMLKDKEGYPGSARHVDTSGDLGKTLKYFIRENGDGQEHNGRFKFWPMKKEGMCKSGSSDGDSSDELSQNCRTSYFASRGHIKQETVESEYRSTTLEEGLSLESVRPIKEETQNPCLNVGEHTYTGRSPARSADTTYSPSKPSGIKMEGVNLSKGHNQISPCLECHRTAKSVRRGCSCPPRPSAQNSSDVDDVPDRMSSKKKKRKKKQGQREPKQVGSVEAAESEIQGITTTNQRKDKMKKQKEGKKVESAKKIKDEPSVEPSFKLVCTSLEELRVLISKTEDELDYLESTKNKLDRWFLRKEAVKELHSTLIRLLNELSPWEPKLVKAYQRNRLRLKKEFDDFKKHPEYNNFVREECLTSSSSSDDEDISLLHRQQGSEDELEHVVPRGLWTVDTGDFEAESVLESSPSFGISNHQKHPETDEQASRVQADSSVSTFAPGTGAKSKCEVIQSKTDCAASSTSKSHVAHPTPGLPKGYTPIPTLLAKSVGNKVTLMKRPIDYSGVNYTDRQSKGCSSSLSTSTAGNAKRQAQTVKTILQQNSLQTQGECAIRQAGMVKVAGAPLTTDWAKQNPNLSPNPLQVISKVPEGRDQLVSKGGSNSDEIYVQSVCDYSTQEKITQQVVIAPSKHVIQKSKEQQSMGPVFLSTSVSGFTIPDNVQQVAPLKDTWIAKTPSLSSPPCHQHRTQNTPVFQVTQSSRSNTSQNTHQNPSSSISTTSLASPVPPNPPEHKQELKTICIRDSQSILVTTRGGNTGIVKVQTSSAQNALDGLSSSPIITISPQFKAFLVSQSAEASSVLLQKNPSPISTVASVSVAQPQKQIPSVVKSSAIKNPTAPRSLTSASSVPGSHKSDASTVTRNLYHPSQTLATKSLVVQSTVDGIAQPKVVGPPGVKRPNTEEQHKVTKFILVNPSSSSCASTVAVPKDSSTNPPLGSRVIVMNQPPVTASSALVGNFPMQATTAGINGQQITTTLSNQSLKIGFNPAVDSNALSKGKNTTLPTGLQIHLSGMTATIGQTIGALSRCTSKSTPASLSVTGCSPAITTTHSAPFTQSTSVTSCLSQLVANATLTRTSQPQSFTISSQLGSFGSTTASHPAGSLPTDILTSHSPAQITSTVPGNPNAISMAALAHQPSHVLAKEASTRIISPTSTQFMSPTIGANNTQQRIVINIPKPLPAGTQILLNNTCFVVPPQGLAPGSHVLIISSPSPHKVPHATISSIGLSTPLQGASQGPIAPQGPVLPKSQARLPGVPVANSPFAACTPAVGPANVQGSALLPSNASLVSVPTSQVCASVLATPPHLAKQAAHVTGGSTLRPLHAVCSTAITPVNTSALPPLPAPLSSLPSSIAPPRSLPDTTRDSCIQLPPTSPPMTHLGLGITSGCQQAPSVIRKVFTGSLMPATHNLPTSTATPIESTTDACVVSPTLSTFQPITLLTTKPIHQPISLTNQSLVQPSFQKSPLGMANSVANKLLISPDGAILSSVQYQAKTVEPNVYPKQAALILAPNSSSGAWRYQLTPSQPNN